VPLVILGKLGRPHGLKGELALSDVTLTPDELLAIREFTWRGARGDRRALTLTAAQAAVPRMLVKFEGVDSRVAAASIVNGALLADHTKLPDPGPDVAYTYQLIGLEVREEGGRVLGALEDIVQTGAHPIYVVRGTREWLIPATPEVVKRVDLGSRAITVALPRGLEDI
jgi:16S rRNA processing protein RimM